MLCPTTATATTTAAATTTTTTTTIPFDAVKIMVTNPGGCAVLRHRSAAAQLLGWQVQIPLKAWLLNYCVRCVLCRLQSL